MYSKIIYILICWLPMATGVTMGDIDRFMKLPRRAMLTKGTKYLTLRAILKTL